MDSVVYFFYKIAIIEMRKRLFILSWIIDLMWSPFMKIRRLLIPYVIIIIVVPALIVYFPKTFKTNLWERIMDILMAGAALLGLLLIVLKKKSKFRGWIPGCILLCFFLIPQLFIWKTQNKGSAELRALYRFALLYVTLFVIPLETHISRKEQCILIGGILLWIFGCCVYEIVQHPRVWESMNFFSGETSTVVSIFEQRNRFGAYLALAMILCCLAMQISGSRYWLIPAVFFFPFLIFTESRGALCLAGFFCLFCFLSYRKHLGIKNTVMILADLGIVFLILWLIPPFRRFLTALIDVDRGVTGRDKIWKVAWDFYREADPFLGHGIGTMIEKVMAERLGAVVSTHNVYLYILCEGGILLGILYILSFAYLLKFHCYRHHYLIPLLMAVMVYGFFELACLPFDYWHLSNLFTVCLFFLPAAAVHTKK